MLAPRPFRGPVLEGCVSTSLTLPDAGSQAGELPGLAGLADFGVPDGPAPGVRPRAPARPLTRKQKAAVIVRLLLAEGVALKLSDLPESLQEELAHQISGMRFVDRATLKAVVEEFVTEIESVGLAFPAGMEGALALLGGAISPGTAARVRKATGVRFTGDPWTSLAGIDPSRLLPLLEEESTEIAAVLLSKLEVSVAADLLGRLPGPRARQLAYAISLTGSVEAAVVDRIGRALAEQLDTQPAGAFGDGPVARVGAILNFSPAATRDDVLEGLDQEDAAFAVEVRQAIFTFANLPERLDPRDVPRVTREVEPSALVTALAGATGALAPAAEFLLGAMSKRMAEQLREDIAALGTVTPQAAEEAMNAVVATVREMEAEGALLLIAGARD